MVLLAVLVAVQVPFIYRRYETGKRAAKIADMQAKRVEHQPDGFREYRGIIHAHTSLGGHSTGGFDELIKAANDDGLDFVLMTEHWSDEYDTSALTLNGTFGKTLFIGGNEIDTADSDRFLMLPGSADAAGLRRSKTDAVIQKLHQENRVVMVTYPETLKTWSADFDGIEVLNLKTAAKQLSWLVALGDVIWTAPAYPELMFAQQLRRPTENMTRFDEAAKRRPVGLFFGSDAHSNIGIHLFGDDAGHKFLNLKLDPYKTDFGIVQLHVLLADGTPLTRGSLIDALRARHYFASVEAFGNSDGFRFQAVSSAGTQAMGDEVKLVDGVTLRATAPVPVRFVVYKDGVKFAEQSAATEFTVKPDGPGEYRVEAYLDQLGLEADRMPWIMSSPIYLR